MATFNILSSCICRDAFGFREDCKHEIITFLQSTSPFTWFGLSTPPKRLLVPEDFDGITQLSNFQKKCIAADYNNNVLDNYKEKADFFVLDFVSFANTNIAKIIDEQGKTHYFTLSKWFNNAFRYGLREHISGKIKKVNALELLEKEELMEKTIDDLVNWLLYEKNYQEKQIILVRNKRVNCYSDSEYLYFFDRQVNRKIVNSMLDKIYDYFEQKMPGCNVIHMPYGVYADMFHKWGLMDLHLCKKYYDYLYSCFDVIASGGEKELNKLFKYYSDVFGLIY